MIKIQKKNFNLEEEIEKIKNKHSDIGALTSFVGYVRDLNNKKNVKSITLEAYEEMARKELEKIICLSFKKWNLIDTLVIHRYGNLSVNEKIVLVASFSQHRKDSYESSNFIMDYLKKNAPFWKKENYSKESNWL